MSQLRNLLVNKVVKYSLAGTPVARFRRTLRAHGRNLKSVKAEIVERQELARMESERQRAKASASKRPGLLRRVGNFLTRALKGS